MNQHDHDEETLAVDFAAAAKAQAVLLEAAGIAVARLDAPWVRNNPDAARRYATPSRFVWRCASVDKRCAEFMWVA